MFDLTLIDLQHYWWAVNSLLGALLVFLMFVQGGQTLIWQLSKGDEVYKSMLVNSLGRKWELGFTTLVTFGGAMFASFPLFYATSFGGAYWAWLGILFCFIIQAVSYEYRNKKGNFLGQKTYETFLFINGSVGVLLLGVAVASFFSGSLFSVDSNNFSHWQSPLRGLELLGSVFNLCLGLALVFLSRVSGAMYFINNIDNDVIRERSFKSILVNAGLFLVFFLAFVAQLLLKDGFSYDAKGEVFTENFKYIQNFLDMPMVFGIFLLGVFLVLVAIFMSIKYRGKKCIFPIGIGIVMTVFALLLCAGYNHTAYYPSTYDLQSSLTLQNSSSSLYTLKTMMYVSFMVPFVLAYIIYAWYSMDRVKITKKEIEFSDEIY